MEDLTNAAKSVLAERKRQIETEGWTIDHDDQHKPGALSGAASAYAMSASGMLTTHSDKPVIPYPPPFFMFEPESWKPKSPREDLVRAGALILAEIEKIDRLTP